MLESERRTAQYKSNQRVSRRYSWPGHHVSRPEVIKSAALKADQASYMGLSLSPFRTRTTIITIVSEHILSPGKVDQRYLRVKKKKGGGGGGGGE